MQVQEGMCRGLNMRGQRLCKAGANVQMCRGADMEVLRRMQDAEGDAEGGSERWWELTHSYLVAGAES